MKYYVTGLAALTVFGAYTAARWLHDFGRAISEAQWADLDAGLDYSSPDWHKELWARCSSWKGTKEGQAFDLDQYTQGLAQADPEKWLQAAR